MLPFLARSQALLPALFETALLQQAPFALSHLPQRFYAKRRGKATTASDGADQPSTPDAAASPASSNDNSTTEHAGETRVRPRPERVAAFTSTIQKINKKLGEGTVLNLGGRNTHNIECLPSGCLTLDIALGGGWPRGRICEIFGQESTGKTTLALHAIAEAQRLGGQAVLIDAEHAFNKEFARRIGVDIDSLAISQPSCGEEALHITDEFLRSGGVDIIVIDSVAALVPKAELEGDIGDAKVALQARLMSQALRTLVKNAAKTNTVVIFVNQIRYKINTGSFMGPTEITAGGQALKFYSSCRVEVRFATGAEGGRHETGPGKDKSITGARIKARVLKNKVAPPYRSAVFVIEFNKGIDPKAALLEACEMLGLVTHKGAHYYYHDQKLGHGREAVKQVLAENEALRAELTNHVRRTIRDPVLLESVLRDGRTSESVGEAEEEFGA